MADLAEDYVVVVVDKNAQVINWLTRAAEQYFLQSRFVGFSNAESAFGWLLDEGHHYVKLVIVDIAIIDHMLDMRFLTMLRSHELTRLIPVIVMSSQMNELIISESHGFGADLMLKKATDFAGWVEIITCLKAYRYDTGQLPNFNQKNSTS